MSEKVTTCEVSENTRKEQYSAGTKSDLRINNNWILLDMLNVWFNILKSYNNEKRNGLNSRALNQRMLVVPMVLIILKRVLNTLETWQRSIANWCNLHEIAQDKYHNSIDIN
jgi:hypothetical protein